MCFIWLIFWFLIEWTWQSKGGFTVGIQIPELTKITKFTPGEFNRSTNSQSGAQREEEENKGQSNKETIT